jgi:hypothetical protein
VEPLTAPDRNKRSTYGDHDRYASGHNQTLTRLVVLVMILTGTGEASCTPPR